MQILEENSVAKLGEKPRAVLGEIVQGIVREPMKKFMKEFMNNFSDNVSKSLSEVNVARFPQDVHLGIRMYS